jgi:hypothetical protein
MSEHGSGASTGARRSRPEEGRPCDRRDRQGASTEALARGFRAFSPRSESPSPSPQRRGPHGPGSDDPQPSFRGLRTSGPRRCSPYAAPRPKRAPSPRRERAQPAPRVDGAHSPRSGRISKAQGGARSEPERATSVTLGTRRNGLGARGAGGSRYGHIEGDESRPLRGLASARAASPGFRPALVTLTPGLHPGLQTSARSAGCGRRLPEARAVGAVYPRRGLRTFPPRAGTALRPRRGMYTIAPRAGCARAPWSALRVGCARCLQGAGRESSPRDAGRCANSL